MQQNPFSRTVAYGSATYARCPSVAADADLVGQLVKVNVLALTRLCLSATPKLAARKCGGIVNIGSVIAVAPSPNVAAYSGSKAYLLNFSRALQAELAKTNVMVHAVMHGPVRSELFGDRNSPFPDHPFMTAETLADTALTSGDAGRYSGCTLRLDDGPCMSLQDSPHVCPNAYSNPMRRQIHDGSPTKSYRS